MMQRQSTDRLRIIYADKAYTIFISSISYGNNTIVNKLKIGYAQYWLVLQKGKWKFISDMPLCFEMKNVLVDQVKNYHGLTLNDDVTIADKTRPVHSIRTLNAILTAGFACKR